MDKQKQLSEIMAMAPVIPVVVIEDEKKAVGLARALVEGGLPVIEVTLRTPAATKAIAAIANEVGDAVIGAGTVITSEQVKEMEAVGAKFLVSPGMSARLMDACDASSVPMLPGVSSCSEAMALGERGMQHLKFFPAEAAGGAKFLASLGGPLPQFTFCPTGGVSLQNAESYLALKNVACVGGSWVAPSNLVAEENWPAIVALAKAASKLSK